MTCSSGQFISAIAADGSSTCSAPSGITPGQTSFVRLTTTTSLDPGNTLAFQLTSPCPTTTTGMTGAQTTDRVIVTRQSSAGTVGFLPYSARISAANTLEVCFINMGVAAADPTAISVGIIVLT